MLTNHTDPTYSPSSGPNIEAVLRDGALRDAAPALLEALGEIVQIYDAYEAVQLERRIGTSPRFEQAITEARCAIALARRVA